MSHRRITILVAGAALAALAPASIASAQSAPAPASAQRVNCSTARSSTSPYTVIGMAVMLALASPA